MILSIAVALCASLLIATTHVIVKLAASKIHPLFVNYFRLTTAALVLSPVLVSSRNLAEVNMTTMLTMLYTALVGPVLAWYLYTEALRRGLVSILHPIANSYPIMAMFLSYILLGSTIRVKHIVASLLVLVGVILVTRRSGSVKFRWKPIMLTTLSALLWSSNVIAFKLLTYSLTNLEIAVMRAITALAIMSPLVLPRIQEVNLRKLKLVLLAGLVGDVIGFTTWITAIDMGPLPVVMPIMATAPIISAMLSKLFLSEELTKLRIVGIIVACIGVSLLSI
ncbi:MAG: hypothetical protein DRJ51_08640 [Thermoprotei archaeon]|nr:MAG: hypothetical protein DRJ51_08640 [Thermoprotei archaeon]